ncbi:uncharacterized protein [Rutidosis leptorrhynchoides]|uniref:uncharacterized protein isoform X1 n=1 Tax=Rutidosis leptorrhynchoides TaxID=125765 RepID=UPI003A99F6D9
MSDKDFMRFRLGGNDRRMSLAEFTRCLEIYSPKQMDEQHFSDYIWSGARVSDIMNEKDFDPNSVWKEFNSSSSSWSWSPRDHRDGNKFPSTIDMDDIYCRLLHMVLTLNIFHRAEDTDKVYLSGMWYLKQIRSKTHVNIPYCVAYYLRHLAAANNPICGGHFVTLIANHFGIKRDESVRFIKYPTGTISHIECRDANVIYLSSSGIFLYDPAIKPPPELEEEEEEEDQHQLPVPEILMASLRLQKELTIKLPEGLSKNKLAEFYESLWKLCPECIVSV